VILREGEFEPILGPHREAIRGWHQTAYKRRDELRLDKADQWADQDAATQGRWVTNLVVAAARDDETDGRHLVRLAGFGAVAVHHDDRLAAQLRFRRVAIEPNEYGDLQPVITAPLTPTAQDWFGNRHLQLGWQASLLDQDPKRLNTNLLVGHTSDPITDGLGRVVVACLLGAKVLWWTDIDSAGGGTVTPARRGGGPSRPSIAPVAIKPKGRRQ
jgi:hypothetical protein